MSLFLFPLYLILLYSHKILTYINRAAKPGICKITLFFCIMLEICRGGGTGRPACRQAGALNFEAMP